MEYEHPCRCDKCYAARDDELRRARAAMALVCRKAIMDACVGRERYTVNELLAQFDLNAGITQSEGPSKTKLPASPDAGGGPILQL